jgi:alpha-tubulin suppressor-like RCC1 family protein
MKRFVLILFLLAGVLAAPVAHCATPTLTAGGGHVLAMKSDGSVVAWGDNSSGQLGDGSALYSLQPVLVAGLPDITAISAGNAFALALAADGSVWAWGDNISGQLGDGTRISRPVPRRISGLSNVTQIAAGGAHFGSFGVALLADGSVWTWGSNARGQIGDGTGIDRLQPVQVQGLPLIMSIAAGSSHVMAYSQDGHVFAWGANNNAQVVASSLDRFLTPNQVGGLPVIGSIAASGDTSYASTPDGTAYWWGLMQRSFPPGGQGPVKVSPLLPNPPLVNVASIGASATALYHSFFLKSSGQLSPLRSGAILLADPTQYLLGAQTLAVNSISPAANLAPVAAAATGGDEILTAPGLGHAPSGTFSVLAMKDGTLLAWGRNHFGQLGDGTGIDQATPVAIAGITNAVAVAAGQAFALTLTSDGRVYAWGDNTSGQLAISAPAGSSVAHPVQGLPGVTAVSAGNTHSLAIASDTTVWAWGDNESGQLGDHTTIARRASPVQIPLFTNAVAVAAGNLHSLVLTSDGNVWSFGGNGSSELGRSASTLGPLGNTMSATPGVVQGIANVSAIAAGSGYSIALKTDGTVWVWGIDAFTSFPDPSIPRQLTKLKNIVAIASGFSHHLALQSNGTMWAWGANSQGQIGNGNGLDQPDPVAVTQIPRTVSAIAAGGNQSLALATDGSLWTWGTYSDASLSGGDNVAPVTTPLLTGQPGATNAIAAGSYIAAQLSSANLVLASGLNTWGQIGDGTYTIRRSPVVALREGGAGGVASNDWFLDLAPGTSKTVPAALVPSFTMVAAASGTDQAKSLNASLNYGAGDLGSKGSVFLTAMIPPGSLAALNAPSLLSQAPPVLQTGTAYVLVQLTPSGWQTVIDAQLFPVASGTLGNANALQPVLGSIDTTQLPGAQFCIGYGKDAASMLANNTMRSVLSIGGALPGPLANCVPPSASVIPQSGLWWNPAEGGRGYTIEQSAGKVFMATYLYDASGRSTWYGAGPAAMNGSVFSAPLTSYSGGQTLTGPWQLATQGASPGNISISFADPTHGTLTWPGGTIPIQRYEFVANGLALPPTATQPQTGWWWNPSEGGRGFSVEVQNGSALIATYMYDGAGNPVWYAADPAPLFNNVYVGHWTSYVGGQTLTGTYHSPSSTSSAGSLTVQFSSPTTGLVTLPNGALIPIQRFPF